jgi:thioredoxin 1
LTPYRGTERTLEEDADNEELAMTTTVTELGTSTFDETIESPGLPVVVEFWAEWCPPCRTIAPILESIATEQPRRVQVSKVNVDEHPELASRYAIASIPTLLVFRDGTLVRRLVGARGRSQLLEEIEESVR